MMTNPAWSFAMLLASSATGNSPPCRPHEPNCWDFSSNDMRITLGSVALEVAICAIAMVVIVRNAKSASTRRLTIVLGTIFIIFQVGITLALALLGGK